MAGSSYSVSCPRAGPELCGHCIGRETLLSNPCGFAGECKDLDVNAPLVLTSLLFRAFPRFTSQGQELVRRKVDVTSGLPAPWLQLFTSLFGSCFLLFQAGRPLLVEPFNASESPAFSVQEAARKARARRHVRIECQASGRLQKRWWGGLVINKLTWITIVFTCFHMFPSRMSCCVIMFRIVC